MTTTAQVRDATVAALTGTTDALDNVWSVRSWPTVKSGYPVLYVTAPKEDRESLGDISAPQFIVTATIRIVARVEVPTLANDAGTAQAEASLERIKQQIDVAVINNPTVMSLLQQYPFTRFQMGINSDGARPFGELILDIGMEFYQGPEDFFPIVGAPFEQLNITADLTNVVDKTGTYPDPPFPASVVPAPRTTGPDGRAEGEADFTLPQ